MKINFKKYPLPKRLRHHTAPNLYFKADELTYELNYYPPLYDTIDWSEIFPNGKAPKILDIGCGKGGFLLDMAELNPELNVLGIELRELPAGWINNFTECEKINNCRALWYSVVNGLPFIEENSIEKAFYLFPDPWSKKRHSKRRAFNQEFLIEVYKVLEEGGSLYLATDVPDVNDYHHEQLEEFGKFKCFDVTDDSQWQFPITNKENFCRKHSIPFGRIICTK
jgi:tRNA (guanine-N7-)-methyltransferase